MVYRLIKWLTSITLKAYFRKVDVRGTENIPTHGPVIFVANHPSAFMDPMLIGTYARRSLHFIAAAEFMGDGVKSWIYRKQLHMIPVYRPSTMPGDTAKNRDMFSQCYELLARGGAVVIFPEGNTVTENRIRKLKTGAARMALGARDHSPDGTEVSIVPVGLNYANPHRFQSEVFVNIGEPITTKGWASDQEGAAALTAEIECRLKKAVIHVEHEELDSLIKKVELIMKTRPGKQDSEKGPSTDEEFQVRQRLVDSVQTVHESQPEAMREIESRLDAYLNKIRKLGISDSSVAALSLFNTPLERARLMVGRPIFIAGFLINAIPYYLTVFIFRRLKLLQPGKVSKQDLNPAFRGSVAIAVGMVVFSNWYIGWALVSALSTGLWWLAFIALMVFYLTGLFTLRYIGWTMIAAQKSKVRKILGKSSHVFAELIVERREIFESINKVTQEFQTH